VVVQKEKKIIMRIRLTVAVRHQYLSIHPYQLCEYVHFIEQGYVPFANVLQVFHFIYLHSSIQ